MPINVTRVYPQTKLAVSPTHYRTRIEYNTQMTMKGGLDQVENDAVKVLILVWYCYAVAHAGCEHNNSRTLTTLVEPTKTTGVSCFQVVNKNSALVPTSKSSIDKQNITDCSLQRNHSCFEMWRFFKIGPWNDKISLSWLRYLIEEGANVDSKLSCIKRRDGGCIQNCNCTPLYLAVAASQLEFVNQLLKKGANVRAKCEAVRFFNKEGFPSRNITYYSPLQVIKFDDNKDFEIARRLIKSGADVNSEDENGRTVLHGLFNRIVYCPSRREPVGASQRCEVENPISEDDYFGSAIELIKDLKHHNIDVNSRDNGGNTPLMLLLKRDDNWRWPYRKIFPFACRLTEDNIDLLAEYILDNGVDVDLKDNGGTHYLHIAVDNCWVAVAGLLLNRSADVNIKLQDDRTSLHLIRCPGCCLEMAKLLIKNKANVNAKQQNGETPFLRAAYNCWAEYAKMLIENGAAIDDDNYFMRIAIRECCTGVAKVFLDRGVEVNTIGDDGEDVSLMMVGCSEDFQKMMIEAGADVNATDKNSDTPLLLALKNVRYYYTMLLVHHCADVTAKDSHGWTPLHLAVAGHFRSKNCTTVLAEKLIKSGANVNAESREGWTPLHLAVQYYKPELLYLLLQYGANINATLRGGWTALHMAVRDASTPMYAKMQMVRFLVTNGANVNAKHQDGWTPWIIAHRRGEGYLTAFLEELGAQGSTLFHRLIDWVPTVPESNAHPLGPRQDWLPDDVTNNPFCPTIYGTPWDPVFLSPPWGQWVKLYHPECHLEL